MFGFHTWTKKTNVQIHSIADEVNSEPVLIQEALLCLFFDVKIEGSISRKEKPWGLIICPFYSCTYILFTWKWLEIPGTLDPHYYKEIIMSLIRLITILNYRVPNHWKDCMFSSNVPKLTSV